MSILVEKAIEFIRQAESDAAADIFNEISKQYDFLIDQSLHIIS